MILNLILRENMKVKMVTVYKALEKRKVEKELNQLA